MAGFWLFANVALAFHSLRTVLPEPQILIQEDLARPYNPDKTIEQPVISEDIAFLRDPFSAHPALDEILAPKAVPAGHSSLLLQGAILSRKRGVVLKDTSSGAVYFLSEGQEIDGVSMKNITTSTVIVEVDGKKMDFPISGVKE